MSKPFDYADGATGGEPQGPPNVYLPQGGTPPVYDAYADPAAAHGWQDDARGGPVAPSDTGGPLPPGRSDAVGETRELRVVPMPASGGRSGAGRRARRKPPARRSRRVAVAAGAVGAVSAAVLIAGVSFSGGSSGGTRGGEGGRTDPAAGESSTASPADTGPAASPDAPLAGRPGNSDEASGAASPSPSPTVSRTPSASATDDARPPAGTSTTTAPADTGPSPTAAPSAPGRSDGKPGHGPGGTKGPK
ncbi:hypothetical protein ACIP39_07805 [Streptomyces tibetensis]|uniref:hypothetical protein n=1 Tax=Streptomyces tibetensis TaxID=2382123 RepID=UPI00382A8D40